MPILNYTTKIDSYKTITEIQQILSRAGAKKMVMDNDDKGNPVALMFAVEWTGRLVAFSLPCNFKGIKKAMENSRKVPRNLCTNEQAIRVGWRILKNWVESQLAIVEADLCSLPEVFAQYSITKNGDPLYKHLGQNNQLLLEN